MAGQTQGKLAKRIGISANTMTAKINGRRVFNTEEVIKICNELGITGDQDKMDIFFVQNVP